MAIESAAASIRDARGDRDAEIAIEFHTALDTRQVRLSHGARGVTVVRAKAADGRRVLQNPAGLRHFDSAAGTPR
ncbi:hypothetical protein [Nocardia jejuensis]|uniref:hypothetical protein n=1 Tax=Nocardia jejuensis TaxID=328049 RepID=UPI0012F9E0BD|nr:hypothetical protein [Nocardia jejuensis]